MEIYFDYYLDFTLKHSNGDCCHSLVAASPCITTQACDNNFEVCYRLGITTELFLTCQTTGVLLTAPDPVPTVLLTIYFTLNQTLGNGVRNLICLFLKVPGQ